MCTDEDDEQGTFADRSKQVDRGGLKNVNDRTFHVFLAMETRVREFLKLTTAKSFAAGVKDNLLQSILADEDVLFFWSILAAEWDTEEEQALLPMLAELWVTIRGFSFAKSWRSTNK